MGAKVDVRLEPGRWLVEVRENGGYTASRISGDDVAHGGRGPSLAIPGVSAWFDNAHTRVREEIDSEDWK